MRIPNRKGSFLVVLATYGVGCLIAIQIFRLFASTPVWAMLWADLAATVFVWMISTLWNNASVYDPYWSTAPMVIGCYWAFQGFGHLRLVTLFVLFAWSIRLTCNWARRWRGLEHQDWRYTDLQRQNPRLYPLINLCGIHILPTLLVYLGLLPVYDMMKTSAPLTLWVLPGVFVCLSAVTLEFVADLQMDRFRRAAQKGFMHSGVWAICRHPNYLAEILFWWGLWLMQVLSTPGHTWGFIGTLAITALFVFVSVPMMDRHMLSHDPGYAQIMQRYPALLPWRWRLARTGTLSK